MSQPERTRVAIVGAGIVGLTLAVALNAFDKERKIIVDIYEAAPEIAEIGAGINAWPRTWTILKEIGLERTLIPLFDHFPDLEPRIIFGVRKGDQKDGFNAYDVTNNGGALRIHRADLQRSLMEHLPLPNSSATQINTPCTLHLDHRLTDYVYDGPGDSGSITLHFADESSAKCDILVGADGIKSTVRQFFLSRLPNPQQYERYHDPVWSGTFAFRGLVSREELEEANPGHRSLTHPGLMYVGKSQYCAAYPVSGGKFLNVVAIVRDTSTSSKVWEGPWRVDVTREEFLEVYEGWDEEVLTLIKCIKEPTKWCLQALDHLDIFAKGRVFLTGDSAHAMLPHLGAGASVGIEDAYILASMLTHPATSRTHLSNYINQLADIYNTARVPSAIAMSKSARQTGLFYHLEAPGFEKYKQGDDIPKHLLADGFRQVERNWAWTTTDPGKDRKKAEELLEREVARHNLQLN